MSIIESRFARKSQAAAKAPRAGDVDMNLIAELTVSEDRIVELIDLVRRQAAIMHRLHELGAPPWLIREGDRLIHTLANALSAAMGAHDRIALALEASIPDSLIGGMQFGMTVPHLTIDNLPLLLRR
jgi:hypothetical protein